VTDPARERLTGLRNHLLRLHKILLDSERAAYERDVQRITSTGQYLQLVLNDPWFGWLHELSQFIVIIDEKLDDKEQPATAEDADRLTARARDLIAPNESASTNGFHRKYFDAMQRDPDVVLAHRDMVRAFEGL
jgi:uncharacterized protein with von Willebrand factor type A (vWA) domain